MTSITIVSKYSATGSTIFGNDGDRSHKFSGDTTIVGDLALNVAGATTKRNITSTASEINVFNGSSSSVNRISIGGEASTLSLGLKC